MAHQPDGTHTQNPKEKKEMKFTRMAIMYALLAVVALIVAPAAFPQSAPAPEQPTIGSHALAKIGKALLQVKKVAGVPVFAAEAGVDVAHVFSKALAAASGDELLGDGAAHKLFLPVHAVFVGADYVIGKADDGLEKAEQFLFDIGD
jgi:hypothetical protein